MTKPLLALDGFKIPSEVSECPKREQQLTQVVDADTLDTTERIRTTDTSDTDRRGRCGKCRTCQEVISHKLQLLERGTR